jgi:hypothetical protein
MQFKATQFDYQLANKSYVAEASDLRIGAPHREITIDGNAWFFSHTDRDASGEDVMGWNFVPTMGAVSNNPALAGHKVLIIND